MCNCIKLMDAQLADHNGALVTTFLADPPVCVVEVYQLKTGRGQKKPPKVLASFCPMCGEKYAKTEAPTQDAA